MNYKYTLLRAVNVTDPHVTVFLGVSALWVDDRLMGFIFMYYFFISTALISVNHFISNNS